MNDNLILGTSGKGKGDPAIGRKENIINPPKKYKTMSDIEAEVHIGRITSNVEQVGYEEDSMITKEEARDLYLNEDPITLGMLRRISHPKLHIWIKDIDCEGVVFWEGEIERMPFELYKFEIKIMVARAKTEERERYYMSRYPLGCMSLYIKSDLAMHKHALNRDFEWAYERYSRLRHKEETFQNTDEDYEYLDTEEPCDEKGITFEEKRKKDG